MNRKHVGTTSAEQLLKEYKKDQCKIATQLAYPEEIKEKIDSCQNFIQIDNVMIQARKDFQDHHR